MTSKQYRLREDIEGRLMPVQTLHAILESHRRSPAQQLYLWGWRHGPGNKLTIYDLDLPRRQPATGETLVGYERMDWWHHSVVCNVPGDYMLPWGVETAEGELLKAGYKHVLIQLLQQGCVVPSKCLDDWLGDDSRKYAEPILRLLYRDN